MLCAALPPKHGFMGRRRWTEMRWRCSEHSKRNLKMTTDSIYKHHMRGEWRAGSKGSIKMLRINGSWGQQEYFCPLERWGTAGSAVEAEGKEPCWLCGEAGAALWKGQFVSSHLMGNCNLWLRKVVLFLWLIKKYKYSFAVRLSPSTAGNFYSLFKKVFVLNVLLPFSCKTRV